MSTFWGRKGDADLKLEPNLAAPEALRDLGIAYWEVAGIDPETGDPLWAHKTSDLGFRSWSGTAHYAAAAAVTATVSGHVCANCQGELTLTSRQALTDARRGRAVKCRACNDVVEAHAANVLRPGSAEGRAQRLAAAEARERSADAARELEHARRDAIAARYPAEPGDVASLIDKATLLAKVGALAVLHAVGDKGGLVYPVDLDSNSIGPNHSLSRDLFLAAWHNGLLRIHPSSPTDAFTWEPDGELGDDVYVGRIRFCAAGNGELKQRIEDLAGDLRVELELANLGAAERAELAHLAVRITAEEAGRYFAHKLREHRMPGIAEEREEALRTAAIRGASQFALGHLYRMAWSSARDSSSAYQRHAGMPKESAAAHGLNQFERWVQRACDAPSAIGAPYREEKGLPLSAVTGVVFRAIMGLDPMSATPADIRGVLGVSPHDELPDVCGDGIPEHHELMEWLRASPGEWRGNDFRRALAVLEYAGPGGLCGPCRAHGQVGQVARDCGLVYDRIISRVGEEAAAIVLAEATAIANGLQDGARAGDALLAEVLRLLGIVMP